MARTFKEYISYIGGFRSGSYDNITPMASLGDRPPKGQGGKDSRGVGLNANYSSQAPGTMRPFITANKKKVIDDVIQKSYDILDEKYNDNKEDISDKRKERFEKFQEKFENEDESLRKNMKNDVDLLLINGTNEVHK